jgi:hypothetical protein
MLSRLSTPTDRLVKVTLIATLASLAISGGLLVAQRTRDVCAISSDGLDAQGRLFVARRVLACRDYERGLLAKDEYRRLIGMDVHAPQIAERVTWASAVLSYSTQYSEQSWSAQQALGAPNVFPQHGDVPQAWASKTADEQDEWIEVGFEHPRAVSAVEIYETFNPAVASVELITTSGRRITVLAPSVDVDRDQALHTTIPTPCTTEPIAAVRVNVSSTTVKGWNEIDAIGLVSCGDGANAYLE